MRLAEPFDPIEVGEIDTFVFDMTRDAGSRTLVAVTWSAYLTPYSHGIDPDPQSRINKVWVGQGIDIAGQQAMGQYAFAQIGPMPAYAAGATYILDVHGFLGNGDIIALNSTVLCVLPGQ